jgi:hypothetical protein
MTKTVTFSPEALQAVIAQAVAEALKLQGKAKPSRGGNAIPTSASGVNGKTERSIQNEIKCVKAFKRAGFKDAVPHVNVKSFRRWAADGFRPLEGSKSVKVGNLRLFHVSQVRALTVEEKAAMQEQSDAAVARYEAAQTVSNVTPIQ